MKYRLPVRTQRALANGPLKPRIYANSVPIEAAPTSLPHPYSNRCVYGTARLAATWTGSLDKCRCAAQIDEEDGFELCRVCGWVGGSTHVAPPVWHGTHTIIMRHTYDPSNYMKLRLKKVGSKVPRHCMDVIMRVYPSIYDAFKRHCKGRKNMICYGFVITKLIEKMGYDPSGCDIKMVKTSSKVKENARLWDIIMRNCPLHI